MGFLSNCIADFYIKKQVIKLEEKEIYKAGIALILNEAFTFLLVLLIAGALFEILYGILFLIVFCLTRVYCGGFHAKTTVVCRTTMLGIFLGVALMSYALRKCEPIVPISICVISFFALLPFIPVKHPNKNLSDKMRKRNKRRGIVTYVIFSICSMILFSFNKQSSILIALSLMAVSALAVIGTIINERRES